MNYRVVALAAVGLSLVATVPASGQHPPAHPPPAPPPLPAHLEYRRPPVKSPKRAVVQHRTCNAQRVAAMPAPIRAEWMRLYAGDGPMGCPVDTPHSHDWDKRTVSVRFFNGSIATNPVWPHGAVAVYQTGGGYTADWNAGVTGPAPRTYSKFLVRWEAYRGNDPRGARIADHQIDLSSDDTKLDTSGLHSDGVSAGKANYMFMVQGYANGKYDDWIRTDLFEIDPAARREAYDVPPGAWFPTDYLDFGRTTFSALEGNEHLEDRIAEVVRHMACNQLLKPTAFKDEVGTPGVLLAKLEYADYFQSDHCPGRTELSNRQEAYDWILHETQHSSIGTSFDGVRTGEYDIVLARMVPAIYRHWDVMPENVRLHILQKLLTSQGKFDPDNLHVTAANVPETENHLLNIHTSQYLTNDILFQWKHDAAYDNAANGNADEMLRQLQQHLKKDFLEYNSRAYTNYQISSLLNLASYASERTAKGKAVKEAARLVLDYLFAKFAASSVDLRRLGPWRRHVDSDNPNLIDPGADPVSWFMMVFAGKTDGWGPGIFSPQGKFYLPSQPMRDIAIMAATSDYRPAETILDIALDISQRHVQRFRHYAEELYARSPSYMLSAGGYSTPAPYGTFFGIGSNEAGRGVPTTLLPDEGFDSRDKLIRFDGDTDQNKIHNMCVTQDFACGINLEVPWTYTTSSGLPKDCAQSTDRGGFVHPGFDNGGNWVFFDEGSPKCVAVQGGVHPRGNGKYYVAIYRSEPANAHGHSNWGFLEAFDLKVKQMPFLDFVKGVLARNEKRKFSSTGFNTYVRTDGGNVQFTLQPKSAIVSAPNHPTGYNELAAGGVLNSTVEAFITVDNRTTGESLTLDHRDINNPKRSVVRGRKSGPH
jgi:hypothetical protein